MVGKMGSFVGYQVKGFEVGCLGFKRVLGPVTGVSIKRTTEGDFQHRQARECPQEDRDKPCVCGSRGSEVARCHQGLERAIRTDFSPIISEEHPGHGLPSPQVGETPVVLIRSACGSLLRQPRKLRC